MSDIFSVLQLVGGVVLVAGYPLQLKRLITRRSSQDFSLLWTLSIFLGILLMQGYAIDLALKFGTYAFLCTNSLAFLASGSLVLLVIHFRKGKKNE